MRPLIARLGGARLSSLSLSLVGLGLRGSLALVSLVNVVVLARALGPDGRGQYFLVVAWLAVLTRVADGGLSLGTVVFTAREPAWRAALHRALLRVGGGLWLLGAAVGTAALWLLGGWLLPDLPRAWTWLLVLVLPFTLYEQWGNHFLVGLRAVLPMNLLHLGGGVVTLALNLVLVAALGGGVETALAVYVGVTAAKVAAMLSVASRLAGAAAAVDSAPADLGRRLLRFGLRGYPNNVAVLLWSRVPAFVLRPVHGAAAVGYLSVGQQLVEQLLLPVQAVQDAIYQRVAGLPRHEATAAMNRYLRVTLWGMLPLLGVVALLAPWAVRLLFGDGFEPSIPVVRVLLLGAACSTAPALLSPYFFGQLHRPGLQSLLGWLRVATAFGLTLLLAPGGAELGAAAALAGGELVLAVASLGLYARLAHTSLADALLPRADDLRFLGGQARLLTNRRAASR